MKTNKDYLNRFKEWQDHQYDPGYYTGGNIPPAYTNPRKPARLGWFLIIQGGAGLIAMTIALVYMAIEFDEFFIMFLLTIFINAICIVSLISGLRLIKKRDRGKK